MPLADRNQPVKALFLNRPHEAFRVRVRIWGALGDTDDADTSIVQSTPHVIAPLPIPIADQNVWRVHRTIVAHRQRPDDLLHEQRLGMRGGPEDLHAAGGQVDDEHRVVRDQSAPRPDFRRKEIGAGNTAPVRFQKRLPRRRALRDRRQARRLQDPPNGRAPHAMANVRERTLDPRVAPRRILRRHPHHELTNLE
jgi:hypothetical protein